MLLGIKAEVRHVNLTCPHIPCMTCCRREADEAPAKRHKGRKAAAEVPGASAAAPSGKEGDVAHGAEGSDEEAAGLDALRTLACAAALQEEQDDTATKHKKASKKAQGQAVAKPKPAAAKPNDGGAKAGAMQQLNPEYLASGEVRQGHTLSMLCSCHTLFRL